VSLLTIALVIIVVGVLLWLAQTYIPMDANIKKILTAVVVVVLVLWVLAAFGVINIGSIQLR